MRGPGQVRGAAVAALVAAAWLAVAAWVSVWFDLQAEGFGGGGFVAPGGVSGAALVAAGLIVGVLALAVAVRPDERRRIVLAVAALVLSVGGLAEWWSEATIDADLPAGAVRETPVDVLVAPSTAGWWVLGALVALQVSALVLLPRRRTITLAVAALIAATMAVGVLAPDRLTAADHGITVIR